MTTTSSPSSAAPLRLFEPPFDDETARRVAEVLKTGQVMQGSQVAALEAEVAKYLQVPDPEQVVATSSGYTALELALATTPSSGYKVLVPGLTMVATIAAVVRAGLVPKIVDVGPDLQLSAEIAREALEDDVGGIVAVDYGGRQPDMRALQELCREKDLMFWEDAAHAFGSMSGGARAGELSDLACFSLHPIKPLPALGGGLIVNNIESQPYLHVKPRRARYYGIQDREGPFYNVKHLGINGYMTDVSATVARQFLPRIGELNAKRNYLGHTYNRLLGETGLEEAFRPLLWDGGSTYHLYTVICGPDVKRREVHERLRAQGIETGYHYIPLHHFGACKGFKKGPTPNLDLYGPRLLTLPCHQNMTGDDVARVIEALKGALKSP